MNYLVSGNNDVCIYDMCFNTDTFKDENKKLNPAEVKISTSLETVIDIAERNHIIELKFEMNIEWYEIRAHYYNIKRNSALNVLSEYEMTLIWMPYILFKVRKKIQKELR